MGFDPENVGDDRGHDEDALRKGIQSDNLLNVPNVGLIHQRLDLLSHDRERAHFISFVGSTNGRPGHALVRKKLKAACDAVGDERVCVSAPVQRTGAGNLMYKWRSTWCLEPNGYGIVRQSVVDSIQPVAVPRNT